MKRQAIEQQLAETREGLEEIAAEGITNAVTEARHVALVQRQAKLNAELAAIESQRKAYERAEVVYELDLELAKRKANKYAELLAQARNELSERRRKTASQQAQAAEQQADRNKDLIDRNPASLGELASDNQALTKRLQALVAEVSRVPTELDGDTATNNTVAADYKLFESEYGDDSKLSQASGELLRDQRAKLPRVAPLKAEILRRTNQKRDIGFRRFEANQQLQGLQDLDAEVTKVLAEVDQADRQRAAPVVRSLLANQRDYLTSYVDNLNKLEVELAKLISVKEQLLNNTQQFREFIAQRDLWIRSCLPLWAGTVEPGRTSIAWHPFYNRPGLEALFWSLSPANWLEALGELQAAVAREPLLTVLLIATFVLLLYAQQRARSHIRQLGEEASKKTCTDIYPTLRTLWLTAIVALPWPLLIWSIGWLLDGPLVESEFARALSVSTRSAAWLLLFAEFLRQMCRPDGLAEAHLGWPRSSLLQLRRYLRWVPVVVVPLVFWLVGLDAQSTQALWVASLGRTLFLVVTAYFAFALWRLLMSKSSAIYQALDRGTENWLLNLHRVWRPAVVMLPLALGVMAMLGYYYTAQQLSKLVLATAALLLCLMIAGGMLRRWVLLNRRKLAREQARQRRAQAQAAAAEEGDEVATLMEVATAEETVDLTALSEQTRKLLQMLLLVAGVIGTVVIWQDVFPALAWLDNNPLPWLSGDDPMTWGNLLRCLLALAITYAAVRDIPGLLELVVLQHLPIDQGARYAISTLARYALLTIGIVVAATMLGITGTSISWLVAAMGVGLGFGLQEIFANFVSGIILLFERPIRVGDIVTLGDTTGIVNRIRMRATTIVDWDRKEYVVPNKDLVTERLLNWTLSDQTTRIVINVGVAYGSDTERACALLREVVDSHPEVLKDPVPLITFEGFGDSTLNIVVRCYLPSLDKRLMTIHDLHTMINKRFNAEGIEIAFPQRDLHIRSFPPEWEFRPPSDSAASNGARETPQWTDAN